jgi:Zn-dependent protease with chaperone function
MLTTLRAGIAVLMLAGFYLLAVGLVGAIATASWWLWQRHPGAGAAKLSIFAVLLAGGLVVGMWKAARARPAPPEGLAVPPYRAPQLWDAVVQLAATVGTRPPEEIRMVPEVNAAVTENTKLLGLVAGRRILYLGVPLVQALSMSQLRSVLAHELGHYSKSHTRLGALAHRGRMVIIQTLQQTGSGLFGWVLRQYAKLYVLVEQAVSRQQEYEADRFSVRVAGRGAAASALRELPILASAWGFYLERYVAPGWERGYAPADLLGGFRSLLQGRADELAALRVQPPSAERSRWDSHPPIAVRIAAIEAQPDTGPPPDDRPASLLIPDLP